MSISCEELFDLPQYTQVKLSMDGKFIYYIMNSDTRKVMKYSIKDKTETCIYKIDSTVKIYRYIDSKIQYMLCMEKGFLSTLKIVYFGKETSIHFEQSNLQILGYSNTDNSLAFVISNSKKELYKWRFDSQDYIKIYDNIDNVFKWQLDDNNDIKIKYIDTGNGIELYYFYNCWRMIRKYSYADYWNSYVVCWNGNKLCIKERGDLDTFSLIEIDCDDVETKRIVFSSNYDVADVVTIDNEVIAVSYYAYRKEWVTLSYKYEKDFQNIANRQYGDLKKVSYSKLGNLFFITYVQDCDVKKYYIYDCETKSMLFLFGSRKFIHVNELVPQKELSFFTRDGIQINGYLSAKENNYKKLIIKIHGGPTQRVYWGYNGITQFFATRDFICAEINYRGSYGYGKKFEELIDKEKGDNVTDDIMDCIGEIEKHYDISDIFLFGWSYGGYIAMRTAIKHRIEKLKGVIAVSSPLNLEDVLENSEKSGIQKKDIAYLKFGNPSIDKEYFQKQNIHDVDITFPLLYAYGIYDNLIDVNKVNEIKKELNSKIIVYEDDHSISIPHNRIDLFNKIEEFVNISI